MGKFINEFESLKTFGDNLGLVIEIKVVDDGAENVEMYYVSLNGDMVSPVLDYDQMNHFLLGWSGREKMLGLKK